jgi:hypothetical protein
MEAARYLGTYTFGSRIPIERSKGEGAINKESEGSFDPLQELPSFSKAPGRTARWKSFVSAILTI